MTTEKTLLPKIRILIADDHQMILDGIRTMLESRTGPYRFSITEASNGEEAVSKVKNQDFDVVLLDYQMPLLNGADAAYQMMVYKPDTKILAISNYDEFKYVSTIMDAGAKGFVLKNIGPSELVMAIEKIMNGKTYFSDDIQRQLINKNARTNPALGNKKMTRRESEVLPMIAEGLSNKEIAMKLHIEKRTVDAHRQNLLKKLGVNNTAGLIRKAMEHKLI